MDDNTRYLVPYDLYVPPPLDWAQVNQGGANWMREIAERAAR